MINKCLIHNLLDKYQWNYLFICIYWFIFNIYSIRQNDNEIIIVIYIYWFTINIYLAFILLDKIIMKLSFYKYILIYNKCTFNIYILLDKMLMGLSHYEYVLACDKCTFNTHFIR